MLSDSRSWSCALQPPRHALLRLTGLAGLAADLLTFVSNALALVGFGRAHAANAGGFFADDLLVDSRSPTIRLLPSTANSMPSGGVIRTGWEIADVEDQRLAVHRGAITDALDFQVLGEALGHADDHVVEQRPGQTVQRAVLALVVRPRRQ